MVFKLQIKVFFIWAPLWFSVRGSGNDSDGRYFICSGEGLLSSDVTRTQHGFNKSLHNETTEVQNGTKSDNSSIVNMKAEYFGQYICTAQHLNNTPTEVDIYVKKPETSLNTTTTAVEPAKALNLTCTADTVPPPVTTWTQNSSVVQSYSRSVTVTSDSGQFTCMAKPTSNIEDKEEHNQTVNMPPKILNSSGCTYHLEILTCMCISHGDPLPTVTWPLLDKQSSYTIINTVVNNSINSTFSLFVEDHSNTTVQCVLSNKYIQQPLIIKTKGEEEKEEDRNMKMIKRVIQLEVILAFFTGILLSLCICCLTRKCCRKKPKDSGYLAEALEMVTSQHDPLVDPDSAEENNHTVHFSEVEAAKSDIEYSNIDFSMSQRNSGNAAEHVHNATNTEYAEIKKGKRREESNKGEEEEMIEGEEETNYHPIEEEDEEAALYSSVKDVMDQM